MIPISWLAFWLNRAMWSPNKCGMCYAITKDQGWVDVINENYSENELR